MKKKPLKKQKPAAPAFALAYSFPPHFFPDTVRLFLRIEAGLRADVRFRGITVMPVPEYVPV